MKKEYKRNVDETKFERERKKHCDVWDGDIFNEVENIGKEVKVHWRKRRKEERS